MVWLGFVDGSVTKEGGGVGIHIITLEGENSSFAVRFECHVFNNEAEYEAVLQALCVFRAMSAEEVMLHTDSQLVSQQILGNFEVKDERMFRYVGKIREAVTHFSKCTIKQIPTEENREADELARIASSIEVGRRKRITLLSIAANSIEEVEVGAIEEIEDWRGDIIQKLQIERPNGYGRREAKKYIRYFLQEGQLYKRGFSNPHLKCLSWKEGEHLLQELHVGCCGAHTGVKYLVRKVVRAGFYWTQMEVTATQIVKKCQSCQKHRRIIHIPGEELGAMFAACPFDKWGIDIVGKLPMAPWGKAFLVVAEDYFSKINEGTIQNFLWRNICCRYGIPRIIVSDNGSQFTSQRIQGWCESMSIKQRFVYVAHPQANGQVEVTNRILSEGIKKRLEGSKGKWVEELDIVLWAYRTSSKTATGETPFALAYGGEAVIPAKIIYDSPRIESYNEHDNRDRRREELDGIDLRKKVAQLRKEKYKSQVRAQYNKRVKIRRFAKGDLVLKRADVPKPTTKWDANWRGLSSLDLKK